MEKGQLQVSEKERKVEYESKQKDVASIIVQKCVNTETERPFTIRQVYIYIYIYVYYSDVMICIII